MSLPTHYSPPAVRLIRRCFLGLIIVLVLAVGILKFGVSVLDWQGPKVITALQLVPLPAATIGWHSLPYADYLVQLAALRHYNKTVAHETTGVFQAQNESQMRQTTVRKLIRDQATTSLLKRFGVPIRPPDVDRAFTAQILQTGNQKATTTAIAGLYQWTPTDYKHYVVAAAVAREKLREYLSFHEPFNRAAMTQAKAVLALVQADDQPFEELAKKYSEDDYAVNGGDLGFIRRGEQDEVIEQAAFQLAPGQVSDLLHTKYGYHILQVVEKKEIDGQEQARVRQIFIAGPSVDQAISNELKHHRVGVWVKGWRWNTKTADVESS